MNISLRHPMGMCDTTWNGSRHSPPTRGVWALIHILLDRTFIFACLDSPPPAHTDCVSTAWFFLPECLQSKALKEKVNTVHLFLNSAKSSQAGDRMERRKVLGIIEPYFSCSSSVNSRHLQLPSFQNATPFRTYVISPTSSHSWLQQSCTGAPCQHEF